MTAKRFLICSKLGLGVCVGLGVGGCATIDERAPGFDPGAHPKFDAPFVGPIAGVPTPSERGLEDAAPMVAATADEAPTVAVIDAGPDMAGWDIIGRSAEGAPIRARTFGDGPNRLLVLGPIHGNEQHGLGALHAFLGSGEPLARAMRASTIRVIENPNPDGLASNSRGNSRGIDLNRNFPARNFDSSSWRGARALSEPETGAVHDEIERFKPDVVVALHSLVRGRPFVNYDGPALRLAELFADAAVLSDQRWYLKPDMGYPTPGSLGSWLGIDRGVPVITVEFAPDHDPELAAIALTDGLGAIARGVPSGVPSGATVAARRPENTVLLSTDTASVPAEGNGNDSLPVHSGK